MFYNSIRGAASELREYEKKVYKRLCNRSSPELLAILIDFSNKILKKLEKFGLSVN